ncbi:glycosyltransferase family 2 protein [Devosia sp. XJ19-1]|uniref:Glycosyltransferase family 2 protein n=1 Tax=Devosia ureilytica TaxID=2952754 RepID=A0A9Q4FRW7_9HYPH|nr:glycosyltransferase family 2 protein [Devosia ureilytica]MCP8883378.1 glycosyltransferase family 2 protein [Devosia ureilytica]MCP8886254.1 glycosyltransferase family 2 protein [Devosia ureilytica]
MVTCRRTAVLIATYNGEAFLSQQIASLYNQSYPMIDLWFSDDGSNDSTRKIIERTARDWRKGTVHLSDGPRRGFAENFRSLIVNPEIAAEFFAFCDQDDVWDEEKLAVAVDWLSNQPEGTPALYCSRTRIITAEGSFLRLSPLFRKKPDFRNAIVQSIGGGNTMVMNRAARDVMQQACARTGFVSHDWWCYMMITGVGGRVHFSGEPKIGYRQHSENVIGENGTWRARVQRLRSLLEGRFARWNDRNLVGLAACEDMLTKDAREAARLFSEARTGQLTKRISSLVRSGVYRQKSLDQLGLYLASALNKL